MGATRISFGLELLKPHQNLTLHAMPDCDEPNRNEIFISWSGARSRVLANALHDWIKNILPDSEPWLSEENMEAGSRWSLEIAHRLERSNVGVLCVTPENRYSAWLSFEAGAISKSLNESSVCPLLFDLKRDELDGPLAQFQAVEFSAEGVTSLVKQLNELQQSPVRTDFVERQLSVWWTELQKQVSEGMEEEGAMRSYESEKVRGRLWTVLREVSKHPDFNSNKYFRRILLEACSDYSGRMEELLPTRKSFSLPHTLYPKYLITLLRAYKVTVKALAVVDVEERFWRERIGQEILRNTHENSTRVFVYHKPSQMAETVHILRQHSEKYNVYAISYSTLSRDFCDYNYDFSVIGDIGTRVLARYREPTPEKLIQVIEFSTERDEISRHEDVVNGVIQIAVPVKRYEDDAALTEAVFRPPTVQSPVLQRRIEMSAYIDIPHYNEHEEEHAYYRDMLKKMLQHFDEHRVQRKKKTRVLELGAGTGLFTKHLIAQPNVELTAIELDWACFHSLKHTLRGLTEDQIGCGSEYSIECEDSRHFDPEGVFDFIFTSFADHHIKPYDKRDYFENVRRNLSPRGRAIVGDEFLPEYDVNDVEARRAALTKYHSHIIDIAKKNGHVDLVELEEAALRSGLDEVGDFKISCQEYEQLLCDSGLLFEREKIGPVGDDSVGGVYVYVLRPDPKWVDSRVEGKLIPALGHR